MATVASPFIYLRAKNRSDISTKKILMGVSVKGLLKNANKLFKNLGVVRSIYTEDGELVQDMSQVIPGNIYYVSSSDAQINTSKTQNEPQKQAKQPSSNSQTKHKEAFNQLFGQGSHTPANILDISDEENNQPQENQRKVFRRLRRSSLRSRDRRKPNKNDEEFDSDQNNEDEDLTKNGQIQSDSEADLEFEETERRIQEEEERQRQLLEKQKLLEAQKRKEEEEEDYYYYYSDEDDDEQKQQQQQNQQNLLEESKTIPFNEEKYVSEEQTEDDEQTEHRKTTINKLMKELLGENIHMSSKIKKSLDQFKQPIAKFIGNSGNLEISQEENWMRVLFPALRNQFTLDYNNVKLKNILSDYARQIITQHRQVSSKFNQLQNSIYSMRLAIVGPRHSGKSTFLTTLSKELLSDFIATSEWKRTFVFFANIQTIHGFWTSIEGLYQTIIDMTLDSMIIQRPAFNTFLTQMKKYFSAQTILKKVPNQEDKSSDNGKLQKKSMPPVFQLSNGITPCRAKQGQRQDYITSMKSEKELSHKITALGIKLWQLYNDTDTLSFSPFLTQLFMFPHDLAKIFGFDKIFFILDNFEFTDTELKPVYSESVEPIQQRAFQISEYWKFMIGRSNFIISCEKELEFYNALQPLEEDSIDLTKGLHFVSTVGMIEDADDDIAIKVSIEGNSGPFVLTRDHCGGCVAFTSLWMDLNEEFDTYEQMLNDKENEEDKVDDIAIEEKRLELLSQTQQFIDDLFFNKSQREAGVENKENAILVLSVKRDPRSEE